jgi:hypothetical protein
MVGRTLFVAYWSEFVLQALAMTAKCSTPAQLTDALYDQEITHIVIDSDIDMAPEFQRWRELGGVVLERNVTIAGSPALAYPIINWHEWPQDVPGAWWGCFLLVCCHTTVAGASKCPPAHWVDWLTGQYLDKLIPYELHYVLDTARTVITNVLTQALTSCEEQAWAEHRPAAVRGHDEARPAKRHSRLN